VVSLPHREQEEHGTVIAESGYPMHITRNAMRPDHSATDYSVSHAAIPLAPPTLGDSHAQSQPQPLARITFCFAWLFGLEPFLLGGASEQSPSGMDRRI
jgi:hypothetical protein